MVGTGIYRNNSSFRVCFVNTAQCAHYKYSLWPFFSPQPLLPFLSLICLTQERPPFSLSLSIIHKQTLFFLVFTASDSQKDRKDQQVSIMGNFSYISMLLCLLLTVWGFLGAFGNVFPFSPFSSCIFVLGVIFYVVPQIKDQSCRNYNYVKSNKGR